MTSDLDTAQTLRVWTNDTDTVQAAGAVTAAHPEAVGRFIVIRY